LAVEWIHFPRIRTFVEKRFHGLFSKKKRSKSEGVPSFPRREHVLAVISLPSGQPTGLDPYQDITPVAGLIFETKNREIFLERVFWREITAREQVSRAVILENFEVIQ